ncbi:hypothetical protein [Blastomonas sp.]|uniref:hypothetical protein n=1 Tax=Blastomonas sp. TaxID=1909299 RepID=UPI00406A7999
MRMKLPITVVSVLAVLSAPAIAGDKRYSHKAGISVETANQELEECFDAATFAMHHPTAPNPYNPVTESSAAGAAGAGLAAGAARGLEQGRMFKLTYFGCLESKGYTQRAIPQLEWKSIKKLPKAEQRKKLESLMVAPQPQHPEMSRDEYD